MLKINWIPTNDHYRHILAAPDAATRQQRYQELLVEPWAQMMQMFAQSFGAPQGGQPDPLAGARAWAWLLPDQTDEIAALLDQMEAIDAWGTGEQALQLAAERFAPYANQIPFDSVTGWLVLADRERSNRFERGYTGATDWFQPRLIGQFWELNEHNRGRIGGLLAHELHHLIRLRAFPFDPLRTSVADYIVLEGTAESFAAALFGEQAVGYFITEFDPAGLEQARELIGAGLEVTGFNQIRSYIFGDALAERSGFEPLGGMPLYGGYAIGYHVVQAFLKRSGLSIEEATFLSATEIVAGSGYFG